VATGFIAALARPGANVTGLTSISDELGAKQLELLKEIVPRLSRVSVLGTSPNHALYYKRAELAARALQVQLDFLDVQGPKDIEIAFVRARERRADAGLVLPSPVLESHRTQVTKLAATNRLATMYPFPEFMKVGGLVSYGVNVTDLYRRAATYVDKILKGAKPADLPVEQPTKFELVINLKAAEALGLIIPPSLLLRADQVIQ
jgi:putative ABC transport system substrate-binding protein